MIFLKLASNAFLREYMISRWDLSNFQFGFHNKNATDLLDSIRSSLDASNINICAGIFIDVTNAFDPNYLTWSTYE